MLASTTNKAITAVSPSPSTSTSIEEHLQLQRIFRLLAFDLPLQRINQKLESLGISSSPGRSNQSEAAAHKRHGYLKQRERFTATLQDEISCGRELVSSRFQIGCKALQIIYERLGCSVSTFGKSYAEDLIWQVNDNLDGSISYEEFERSYVRARNDRSGMEPSELFYLTCFLMFDKECSGKIQLDETMSILYLKYGDSMEQEMQLHFSEYIDSGAHFITYAQYRDAAIRRVGELIDQAIGSRAKFAKKSQQ